MCNQLWSSVDSDGSKDCKNKKYREKKCMSFFAGGKEQGKHGSHKKRLEQKELESPVLKLCARQQCVVTGTP